MADHPLTALRAYDRCIAGMLADEELVGDLLLIGLWLARAVHLGDPAPTESGWSMYRCATDLFPLQNRRGGVVLGEEVPPQRGPHVDRVLHVLRRDIRRYDPWVDVDHELGRDRRCRATVRCGKPAAHQGFLTDSETGRRCWIGACRTHAGCFDQQRTANLAVLAEHPAPIPAANAGGALARHLPDIDWPVLWRYLDPDWTTPPEDSTTSARPRLQLLVTDGPTAPVRVASRPPLKLLPGGAG